MAIRRTKRSAVVVSRTRRGFAVRSVRRGTRYFYGEMAQRRARQFARELRQRQTRRSRAVARDAIG